MWQWLVTIHHGVLGIIVNKSDRKLRCTLARSPSSCFSDNASFCWSALASSPAVAELLVAWCVAASSLHVSSLTCWRSASRSFATLASETASLPANTAEPVLNGEHDPG